MARDKKTKKYAYLRTEKGTVPMVYVPGHWAPAFKVLSKNEDEIELLDVFKISEREREELESDKIPASKTPETKTRVDNKHHDIDEDDIRNLIKNAEDVDPPQNRVQKWLDGHTRKMADINAKPKYRLDAQEKRKFDAQVEKHSYTRPGPSKCFSLSEIESSKGGDLDARNKSRKASKAEKAGKHVKTSRDETHGESHCAGSKHVTEASAYKGKGKAVCGSSICTSSDQRECRPNTSKVTFKEKSIRALSILSGAKSSGSSRPSGSVRSAVRARPSSTRPASTRPASTRPASVRPASVRPSSARPTSGQDTLPAGGAGPSATSHGARDGPGKPHQEPGEPSRSYKEKKTTRKLPESYGRVPDDPEGVYRSNLCFIDVGKRFNDTPSALSEPDGENDEAGRDKKPKKERYKTTSATRMYLENTPERLYQSERKIINKKRYDPQNKKEKHYVCVGEGIKAHAFSLTNTSDYMDMKAMLSDSDLDPEYHETHKSRGAREKAAKEKATEEKASKEKISKEKAAKAKAAKEKASGKKSADEGSTKGKRSKDKTPKEKDTAKKSQKADAKDHKESKKPVPCAKKDKASKPWLEVGPVSESDVTEEITRKSEPMVGLKIKADFFPKRRSNFDSASRSGSSKTDHFMTYLEQRKKDDERVMRQEQLLGRPKFMESVTDLTAKLDEEAAAAYDSDKSGPWTQKLRAAADAVESPGYGCAPLSHSDSTESFTWKLDSPHCGWDEPSDKEDKDASASQRGKKKARGCRPECRKCKGVKPVKHKVRGPEDEYLVDDGLLEQIRYGLLKRGMM